MFVPGGQQLIVDCQFSDKTITTLPVSIFILGLALGPLIFAPLSELYGRLPVYAPTSVIFIAFILGCAFATNLAAFIAFRFLSRRAGAASQALSGGTLADVITREQRGKWMAWIVLGQCSGRLLALSLEDSWPNISGGGGCSAFWPSR